MTQARAGAPTTSGRSAEFWGYVMWSLAGLAILVPELIAVFAIADWPTISATIGHLETRHAWVRLVVVFVIVVLAYYAVPQLARSPEEPAVIGGRRLTANGWATTDPEAVGYHGMGGYLVFAMSAFAIGVVFAAGARAMSPDSFAGGYVLYGIIAVVWVIAPSVLAMFFAREVPFPTLFRTLAYLGRRAPWLAAVVLALLVILLIHLAFYPWPQVGY
ncbi:hypothetical protein NDR87_24590 [Nocardia sp. CDC159]|uniref:Uncharacterized protein n=1 Tax=Nocardia pulmonis TaxID=2951408 RepID=A0A9X2EB34_9NOCA|nr:MULTISPECIES: hypothetical protein [Nocardia]MCM6775081.1 hypothetical protein [Nocardia pulmonis]MCM6789551.1 hypothetical protein [Nocardia sp. CDC159]